MLKCKLCGNVNEHFTAIGTYRSPVEDWIDRDGKIVEYGELGENCSTVYSKLECSNCDAETEDIEGGEEWLKENSNK